LLGQAFDPNAEAIGLQPFASEGCPKSQRSIRLDQSEVPNCESLILQISEIDSETFDFRTQAFSIPAQVQDLPGPVFPRTNLGMQAFHALLGPIIKGEDFKIPWDLAFESQNVRSCGIMVFHETIKVDVGIGAGSQDAIGTVPLLCEGKVMGTSGKTKGAERQPIRFLQLFSPYGKKGKKDPSGKRMNRPPGSKPKPAHQE
jgi:hypothetical protein